MSEAVATGPAEIPAAAAAKPASGGPVGDPGEKLYEASIWRTIALHALMVFYLPFAISLPIMLVQRLSAGLLKDSLYLLVFGSLFLVIVFVIASQLLYSSRNRIRLGRDALGVAIPDYQGIRPMLFRDYTIERIPYTDIDRVERRKVIFGNAMVPLPMASANVVTKDGRDFVLGYVNSHSEDPAFPILEIADEVAKRAGGVVSDKGCYRGSLYHTPGWVGEPIDSSQVDKIETGHNKLVMIMIIAVLVLFLAAFFIDTGILTGASAVGS